MKLEFLAEGSRDCPLIRLYAFDHTAVLKLNDLIGAFATGASTRVSLHKQPWIEPVGGCELELLLGKRDRGISQTGTLRFECTLSHEGWHDIGGLLEPFCESNRPDVYQWLNSRGKISLLISFRGTW
jgi:hypothetical protein